MSSVAVLLHDGYYGCGTGAGRSNRALLSVLADHLAGAVRLSVMPIALAPHSPEYAPSWHAGTEALFTGRDVEVIPLDNGTGGLRRFGGLDSSRTACRAAAAHLNALPAEDQPQLIIGLDAPFHGLAPLLDTRLLRRTLLVPRSTALLHSPEQGERIAWERHGLTCLAEAGGRVAAISAHMRAHLTADYRLPADAFIDLPNGLTVEEQRRSIAAPPLPKAARDGFLLAMGRAVPYKGFDDLLQALNLLPAGWKTPHLMLAAVTEEAETNEHQRHLARTIRSLSLKATLLTRHDPALPGLLTHPALRGVVVPSRAEPFGRIPLEAAAAGAAPLIATTAGGLAETVIDGITGISAPPADPPALAAAIDRALALPPERLEKMRRAAARMAAARTYDTAVRTALASLAPHLLRAESALNPAQST